MALCWEINFKGFFHSLQIQQLFLFFGKMTVDQKVIIVSHVNFAFCYLIQLFFFASNSSAPREV